MQAAQIIPGADYALETQQGLKRVRVESVITRRTGKTGLQATSTVEVRVATGSETYGPTEVVHIALVKGPYKEHVALVEEKARQDAARKAKTDAERAARETLANRLVELCGCDEKMIRVDYSGVNINDAAIPRVLKALEGIER